MNVFTQKTKIALCLVSLFASTFAFCQDDYEPAEFFVEDDAIIVEGVIDGTSPGRFMEALISAPGTKTLILVHVPGSADDVANLRLARMVRRFQIHTIVPSDGMVASGGTDLFLAGARRSVELGARIGVHSWAAGEGDQSFEGANLPISSPEHQMYLDYYREMGIPESFYWFTLRAAPAADIHWMTNAEIIAYQMVN